MIKIDRNEQLILVDRVKDIKKVFKNAKELLEYVNRQYEKHWNFDKVMYNNIILDGLDATGKDTGFYIDTTKHLNDIDRIAEGRKPYIVYDAYGRIVDIRMYFNKNLKHTVQNINYRKRYLKKLREKDSGFRREPVSGTGYKRWDIFRKTHYRSTLRDLTIPEYKEYTSPKELKRLTYIWGDEETRHTERNWKYQYKCRKQWMIHSRTKSMNRKGLDDDFNIDELLLEDFKNIA